MIFNSTPVITQYFAANSIHYKQYGLFGHEGLDLVPSTGDWTVFSWFTGKVTRKYFSTVYGNTVIIVDAYHKFSWRLAHLDSIDVNEGQHVYISTKIGMMGATPTGREGIGGTMPAHLHINCIPMDGEDRRFPNNGFKGRVDPLAVLVDRGEI